MGRLGSFGGGFCWFFCGLVCFLQVSDLGILADRLFLIIYIFILGPVLFKSFMNDIVRSSAPSASLQMTPS